MTAQTLVTLLRERVRAEPTGEASRHWHGRHVVSTSWGEWYRRSQVLAAGLIELGVGPGDRVALMSRTRVEWAWLDMAILMAGAVTVPIFPTEPPAACAELLEDCGARLVLAETPQQVQKLLAVRGALPHVETVVYQDRQGGGSDAGAVSIDEVTREVPLGWLWSASELHDRGERALRTVAAELEARQQALGADSPATITYTPGTEGRPKGVILTHGNFTAASGALTRALGLTPQDLQLLYLPLAHAFGRICLVVGLDAGIPTAFARRYRTIREDCQTFHPTFLCSIPRLFEAVEAKTRAELAEAGGLQRIVASWARPAQGEPGFLDGLKQRVVDKLVLSPVREQFGGRLRFLVSGAGPLKVETARFFEEFGMTILQGYGMTETAACTHINRFGANRFGTVGRPLEGVEVRLAPDGELLVRGPNVTPGYWNRPEETRRALDAEGWLHTGDLCALDAEGYLSVTDRKRNIILTATGKVVAPQPLVRALTADPLIADALIHGEQRPFLSALVLLDAEALRRFAAREGIEGDYEALTRDPRVYAAVEAVVAGVNAQRPPHEHIRKFALLGAPLTEGSGELTATHVLKRQVAAEKYRTLLDSFYSERY